MPTGFKNRLRSCAARAVTALFFVVVLSAAAVAQTIPCPVSANTTVSDVSYNASTVCVVQSGVTLTVASSGTLNNVGPGATGGTITNDGTFTNDGNFFNEKSTLTNFGSVFNNGDISGGTVTNTGILDNFGSMSGDSSGPLVLNNAGNLTNVGLLESGGFGSVTASTNTLGATINNTNAAILDIGGPFNNNGTIENFGGGNLTVDLGGTVTNAGNLKNDAGATLSNNGTLINNPGANLVNNGTLTTNGGFENLGILTNSGNSVLDVASGTTLANSGAIANSGVVVVEVGSVLSNLAGGSYIQTAGSLTSTYVAGTMNSVSPVQIQGGELLGSGTINGNVDNAAGLVSPGDSGIPGVLTINGSYSQGLDGALQIFLNGAAPGDFNVLDVSGLATLDGTVEIDVAPGFTPEAGDDFTFLLFGSLSGDFAHFDFDDCPTDDTCSEVVGANSLSLDILGPTSGGGGSGGSVPTPEPSTTALLAFGLLFLSGLVWMRRGAAPGRACARTMS